MIDNIQKRKHCGGEGGDTFFLLKAQAKEIHLGVRTIGLSGIYFWVAINKILLVVLFYGQYR